jgi:hypothetical protein
MRKITIIVGLMFCATTMFAQSACVSAFEKAMYEKYNEVFDNIYFSNTYWLEEASSNGDIERRKYDLQKLAQKLAKKLGVNLNSGTQLDYFKKEPPYRGGLGEIINEENFFMAKFYANKKSAYYLQIQINKAYLKKKSAETMINAVAEEAYHAYQFYEVNKLKNGQPTEVPVEIVKQWEIDFKNEVYDLLPERINELLKKEKQLKAGDLNNVEKKNLQFEIKMLNEEIYGSKSLGRKGCLEERYKDLQLEKDAKSFAEIIVKVYLDKLSAGRN